MRLEAHTPIMPAPRSDHSSPTAFALRHDPLNDCIESMASCAWLLQVIANCHKFSDSHTNTGEKAPYHLNLDSSPAKKEAFATYYRHAYQRPILSGPSGVSSNSWRVSSKFCRIPTSASTRPTSPSTSALRMTCSFLTEHQLGSVTRFVLVEQMPKVPYYLADGRYANRMCFFQFSKRLCVVKIFPLTFNCSMTTTCATYTRV